MVQGKPLANRIAIGPQPTRDDLRGLAAEGFLSVVSLRPAGEEEGMMPPDEEGRLARELGLQYLNIPVAMDAIASPELADRFVKDVSVLPRPLYVHCQGGKRAGIYAAIAIGVEKDLPGDVAVQQARQLGVDPGSDELAAFIRDQVDRQRERVAKENVEK